MLWVEKLNFGANKLLKAHKQDVCTIRPRFHKFSAILSIVYMYKGKHMLSVSSVISHSQDLRENLLVNYPGENSIS